MERVDSGRVFLLAEADQTVHVGGISRHNGQQRSLVEKVAGRATGENRVRGDDTRTRTKLRPGG